MFPGGGAQYAGMARDLYETEPVFRDWMDRGLAVLQPKLDYDIRALWLPEPGARGGGDRAAEAALGATAADHDRRIRAGAAVAIAGASRPPRWSAIRMGENTAACLAGVMTLRRLHRPRPSARQLFDTVAAGRHAVGAAVRGRPCAAAWPAISTWPRSTRPDSASSPAPMRRWRRWPTRLAAEGVETPAHRHRHRRPFAGCWSRSCDRFGAYLRSIRLSARRRSRSSPTAPGQPLTAAEATDPDYWVAPSAQHGAVSPTAWRR